MSIEWVSREYPLNKKPTRHHVQSWIYNNLFDGDPSIHNAKWKRFTYTIPHIDGRFMRTKDKSLVGTMLLFKRIFNADITISGEDFYIDKIIEKYNTHGIQDGHIGLYDVHVNTLTVTTPIAIAHGDFFEFKTISPIILSSCENGIHHAITPENNDFRKKFAHNVNVVKMKGNGYLRPEDIEVVDYTCVNEPYSHNIYRKGFIGTIRIKCDQQTANTLLALGLGEHNSGGWGLCETI